MTRGQSSTTLDTRQLRLLLLLAAHSGEQLSYEAIAQHVWPESQPDREALFGCMSQVRRALGDASRAPRHIKTVPGQGYVLMSQPRLLMAAHDDIAQRPAVLSRDKWRWLLGIGTLVLLCCSLIVLHLWQREQRRATARERDKAEQVSRLMVGSFPLQESRLDAGYQPVMATELLMQSEQRLAIDLAGQQLQAQMLQTIGTTYLRQRRFEQAFAALARTRSLYAGPGKGNPLQFAEVNSELGMAALELGRFNESLGYLGEASLNLRAAEGSRANAESGAPAPGRGWSHAMACGTFSQYAREVLLRTGRRTQGIKLLRESQRLLLQFRTADQLACAQAAARVERLLGREEHSRRVE